MEYKACIAAWHEKWGVRAHLNPAAEIGDQDPHRIAAATAHSPPDIIPYQHDNNKITNS